MWVEQKMAKIAMGLLTLAPAHVWAALKMATVAEMRFFAKAFAPPLLRIPFVLRTGIVHIVMEE